ncbi:Dynein regulatory complex protein 11 like protein [Argiope bruennichi]|uniref:Dynein regulatory complex protein 11 like protein n=1 Tax=Argiope bruennichi TaxID=94029 RepID=A0A8T0E7V8_ARGBR|nr:Dynein regulatory complex protein 11 like protein [Argiope bruennichi]
MTNKTYNNIWKSAQEDLNLILEEETLDETVASEQERLSAVQKTSNLYLRYIQIANRLTECRENILQPQKRRLLQKLIDNCIGRTLELKHGLVSLEFAEVQYLDDALLEMKMTPDQMNIKIPAYFREKTKEEQEKALLIKELMRYFYSETPNTYWELQGMSEKEAVHLLQGQEEARQGRVAFLEAQRIFEVKEENRLKECRRNLKAALSDDTAATRIQRAWRWFIFHKKFRSVYDAEMKQLRMQPSVTEKSESLQAFQKLRELKRHRRDLILKNETEFLEVIREVQKEIETYQAPQAMEDLQARIRTYFEKYREVHGEYPAYPADEEGGSAAMLKEAASSENEQEKVKSEIAVKEKIGVDKKEEEEPAGYALKASKYIPELMELAKEYDKIWKEKEILGIFDKCDEDMIRKQAFREMETSVRLQTDKIMREELYRLTEAFEKDLGKKGKKGGKKGRKKGGKKEKGKGKGKGKKEKDLTPNRSFESLVEELIKEKIIIDYPKFPLSDFIGDYNYVGSIQDVESDPEKDAMPCLGDIRRIINEFPLHTLERGVREVHPDRRSSRRREEVAHPRHLQRGGRDAHRPLCQEREREIPGQGGARHVDAPRLQSGQAGPADPHPHRRGGELLLEEAAYQQRPSGGDALEEGAAEADEGDRTRRSPDGDRDDNRPIRRRPERPQLVLQQESSASWPRTTTVGGHCGLRLPSPFFRISCENDLLPGADQPPPVAAEQDLALCHGIRALPVRLRPGLARGERRVQGVVVQDAAAEETDQSAERRIGRNN